VTAENFNKGVEALNANRAKDAVAFLEKALLDDPKDAEAHKALAMACAQTGNYRGVVDNLKAYLKLKPDASDRGQWEAAIPQFEEMAKPKK
jgi:Flp pilus assembly protein TadD